MFYLFIVQSSLHSIFSPFFFCKCITSFNLSLFFVTGTVTHSASKSAEGFFNVGLNVKFLDYFLPVLSKHLMWVFVNAFMVSAFSWATWLKPRLIHSSFETVVSKIVFFFLVVPSQFNPHVFVDCNFSDIKSFRQIMPFINNILYSSAWR